MADLLSREKEFIKLNKELDQYAAASLRQTKQQQPQNQQQKTGASGATGGAADRAGTLNKQSTGKYEQRFHTYTKTRAGNQPLRKRAGAVNHGGGGDGCTSETTSDIPSERHTVRTARRSKTPQSALNSTAPSSRPDGDSSVPDTCPETPKSSRNTNGTFRKNMKSPINSTRTFTRSNNSVAKAKEAQFTVKYRNPKFVQSPSLEVLIRDECSSMRSKHAIDTESVTNSLATSGATSSRRSIDPIKKQMSNDNLIKFLKSKLTILEEDHERITQEMAQQKELLEKTMERNKKIELQRDQAFTKHNAVAEQLCKVESQLEEATRRSKERTMEQSAQLKELEVTRRELKILAQTNTNLEKRLYRASEELENAKNDLALLRNADREQKESMRVECETRDKQIKCLKKQRADLLNAYKKQLFLIDNLKRQNICMEQSKMIGFGEKEFTKVLDWNAKM